MNVELVYFEDCPNWQLAEVRLREALGARGDTTTPVTYRIVSGPGDVEWLDFAGSPTILVNGRDAFARTENPGGLACRLYSNYTGDYRVPTVGQLQAVLADAR